MRKVRVLFVCYGNICRSPLAEFVFKDMVREAGYEDRFEIASCATSAEHIGDPVDRRSAEVLARHGISCAGKTARRLNTRDYCTYDYIIGMDHSNLRSMLRRYHDDPKGKISLLLDYTDREGAIALMEKIGIGRLLALSDAAAEAIDDLAKNANVPIVLAGLMHAVTAR